MCDVLLNTSVTHAMWPCLLLGQRSLTCQLVSRETAFSTGGDGGPLGCFGFITLTLFFISVTTSGILFLLLLHELLFLLLLLSAFYFYCYYSGHLVFIIVAPCTYFCCCCISLTRSRSLAPPHAQCSAGSMLLRESNPWIGI